MINYGEQPLTIFYVIISMVIIIGVIYVMESDKWK